MPLRSRPVLLALTLLCVLPASLRAQDPGVLVEGETARAADAYLKRLEALGFSGAALIVDDGRTVLRKGYGVGDREAGTPITTASVFPVGSVTKQFTAAAILALEAEGRLSVEDPIATYFADVPPDKQGITLHHLLTHSSGLESDFAPTDFDPVGRERDAYARRALDSELRFAPGTGYEYSNAGYSLLAAVVEIVTGKPYEEALRELVLLPAGMEETGYRIPEWDPARVVVGYREGERWGTILERIEEDPGAPFWQLRGNGGLHTTLGDVERWDRALETDAVLPAAARERMFTPYVPEDPDSVSFYGYGWAIEETPRHGTLVWHNGGNGIFLAELHRWVDEGLTVFVVTTDLALPATPVAAALEAIAFGEPHAEPPAVVEVNPAALARAAGEWRLPSGEALTVTEADDHLAVSARGPEGTALLFPLSDHARELAPDLEARTRAILEGLFRGDYGPLAEAFGGAPIEEIREREEELMADRHARLGAPTGFEIVGLVPMPAGPGVLARIDFARGAAWNTYVWGPEGLQGVRPTPEPPAADYRPVSESAFESFRLRGAPGPRLELRDAGSSAPVLVIHAPEGDVEARRD
ncbi:MAG TPA: serine hydrolase domain-containing protein [Gemmatimonadota bacterium]|nr:serine hydrolase domain-containing protein [Gemmatimonadota bacterium]